MIVTKKMWEEYRAEYEKEATIIYSSVEEAAKDLIDRTGYDWDEEETADRILDDTNCDWKVMPDGRVFCSYFKAEG
nr:MAG TPA: hypothetical protein [Bacteriophage sp.]